MTPILAFLLVLPGLHAFQVCKPLTDRVGGRPAPALLTRTRVETSASASGSIDGTADGCTYARRINEALIRYKSELESKHELLLERSPLPANETDGELRGEVAPVVMTREALICSRLDLPFLKRCEVRSSTIEGAGRGLFAAEDIKEGEVITCYPGDALLCGVPTDGDQDDEAEWEGTVESEVELNDQMSKLEEDLDFEDMEEDEMILWGRHVASADRWDKDVVFNGDETNPPMTSTSVYLDEAYAIMGHPDLVDNPAYAGHLANDGAGHLAFVKQSESDDRSVEEMISEYILDSLEVANAMNRPLGGGGEYHTVMIATRDVKRDEEIFVTYGPDFWLGHAT